MTTGGVLFCHGDLATSLLRAVEGLFGPAEDIVAISNSGLSRQDMATEFVDAVEELGHNDRIVVLSDLVGGSCWQVATEISRKDSEIGKKVAPEISVIGGVNLPMAVAFVHKRDIAPLSELVTVLIGAGRDGVR